MRQLLYSPRGLLRHLFLALTATPLILAPPFNRHIAEGHVFGIFVGTLYLIGPVGRWALSLALIGIVWFSCVRLLLILLRGGVALATTSTGITVQRVTGRYEVDWSDLVAMEVFTKKSRHRTFCYLRVRVTSGGTERHLDIPTNVLSATNAELEIWILQARRLQSEARALRTIAPEAPRQSRIAPRLGFGRKPDPRTP